MIRNATLALALVFGLMLPACGGSDSASGGFCNDFVNALLDQCDVNDAADAAMLEEFIGGMDSELSYEDAIADNGSAAKAECETGFEGQTLNDQEQALLDGFVSGINSAADCEGALFIASAIPF